MIRISPAKSIFLMALLVLTASAARAAHVDSLNITGAYEGSFNGTVYTPVDVKGLKIKPTDFSADITQTVNNVTITTNVTFQGLPFSFTLQGAAGNFRLWAAQTQTQGQVTTEAYLTGSFDAKAKKITGEIVAFSPGQFIGHLKFSLKHQAAGLLPQTDELADAEPATATAGPRLLPAVLVGKFNATEYFIVQANKAQKFVGTIDTTNNAQAQTSDIVFRIKNDANPQSYLGTPVFQVGNAVVFYEKGSGSDSLLLIGLLNKTKITGNGWSFAADHVVDIKFNEKESSND